jgi:dipeptidyl aminopeptidase/acylaminoacyl peptidase
MGMCRTVPWFMAIVLLAALYPGCSGNRADPARSGVFDATGIPMIPDSVCTSVARYRSWNYSAFADWSADGVSMVVLSRSGETGQIHFAGVNDDIPKQFSFFSEPVTSIAVCPDSGRHVMLFTRDSGGNENFQIFVTGLDTCRPRRLTAGGATQNDGMVWSNAGDCFAFESNCRNGIDFDIYISDMTRARPVLARGGAWSCLDWSPDDARLLVQKYHSRTGSWIGILDLKTGSVLPLGDTTDTVSQESAVWAAGGDGIFLTSDRNSAFRTLRFYDCRTRKETELTQAIAWDVREIEISPDRSRIAFMTNENGFSQVYLMNAATFEYRQVPGLPRGGVYHFRFNRSGSLLGMTISTPQHPEESYALRLSDFSLTRRTKCPMGGIDPAALNAPELVRYPTFDSASGKPRMIPCFVFMPRKKSGPCPVLVFVHGGPESQFWPYFSSQIQYFVNELGVAVLTPNVRGSGGYGRTYLQLDNGYNRENSVRDIGALLDWAARQPSLDASRVGIMGGSYGGYVALASMALYGDRISCGVDLYGISSFVTFLEHTSGYRRDLRRAEYGDERDSGMHDFLTRISPLSRASRIAKPLFIIQGANDPRVPLAESRSIADAVRKNKNPVWLLVAQDEGHGFRKKSNIDYQECAESCFLQTFLLHHR